MNTEILKNTVAPFVVAVGETGITAAALASTAYLAARREWEAGSAIDMWQLEESSIAEIQERYKVCRNLMNIVEALVEDNDGDTSERVAPEELFEELDELDEFFSATDYDPNQRDYDGDLQIYNRDGFEDMVRDLVRDCDGIDIYDPPSLLWGAIDAERVVNNYAENSEGCIEFEVCGNTYYLA